jgi:LmbE family N-acetylglucosaminyl deacetylase
LRFVWEVFSADEVREAETRSAADRLLGGGDLALNVHSFRGSYFPQDWSAIKDAFEVIRRRSNPDLILTHFLADRHQDHRVLSELTWNTFRNHAVLEYEIPKYEGDLAHPGVFCPLTEAQVEKKIATLLECFVSQRNHQWFDGDLFRGYMRMRGVECNSPSRFAEAFHARKLAI